MELKEIAPEVAQALRQDALVASLDLRARAVRRIEVTK